MNGSLKLKSRGGWMRLYKAVTDGCWVLSLVLIGLCVGGCNHRYEHHDLKLVSAYRAKETCSCIFVQEMPEEFCMAWTKAAPNVASVSIDHENKRVTSKALWFWSAAASLEGGDFGCRLE